MICPVCHREFEPTGTRVRCCSPECVREWHEDAKVELFYVHKVQRSYGRVPSTRVENQEVTAKEDAR